MPLLTTSVPNLVQGVSQQPDNLRYPGQAEEQVNAYSSVVDGLTKRPNTNHVKDLFSTEIPDDSLVHFVDRDSANQHVMVFANNGGTAAVSIFTVDGTPLPVSINASAQTYLNSGTTPLKNLRALTVADYTLVANNEVTVSLGASVTDPLETEALAFVKQGADATSYMITLDGILAEHTPAGTSDSESIAAGLDTAITTMSSAGRVTGLTITNGGTGYRNEVVVGEREEYGIGIEDTYYVDVTFTGGGGSGAKGRARVDSSTGEITGITMTSGGAGYTTAPDAVFTQKRYGSFPPMAWTELSTISRSEPPLVAAVATGTVNPAATITTTRHGNLIKITKTDGLDFTISSEDGLGNTGLGVIYKEVESMTDLPKQCFKDFRVKVRGDVELNQDDYYVKFETKDNEQFGEGSWVETVGWKYEASVTGTPAGEQHSLSNSTVPIQIVPTLNASGIVTAYTIEPQPWTPRRVGDSVSSPLPSFVGSKINDIFFYKNRLGILTDGSVVFSESDEYFNFWRTTVQTLLDGDPIDVGVAHTKVSTLKHAVPFQEKLVLFGPQSQFVLRGTDLLTPKTVNISPITEYDVADDVKPLAQTGYVYFPFSRANHEGVYEFYVDNTTDVFEAAEITAQTPKYVPTSLRQLVGTPSEDVLVATSSSNLKHLYVYKYFWQNKEKIQSSWSRFEFTDDVVGAGFIDSDLYLVTKDGTKTNLERMSMESGNVDTGKDYAILLDKRVKSTSLSVVYNVAKKRTVVSLMPYDPVGSVVYTEKGRRLTIQTDADDASLGTVEFSMAGDVTPFIYHGGIYYECLQEHVSSDANEPGTGGGASYWSVASNQPPAGFASDWSNAGVTYTLNVFYVGREYDMEYTFSTQTLKQPTERGGKATSNFTYQTLRNGAIDYADTGHFTVEVTPLYRDTYNYAFNPTELGADSLLGSLVVDSGSFRFPIHAKHDETTIKIKSSSALPAKLLAAEFESFVTPRSRRYGS